MEQYANLKEVETFIKEEITTAAFIENKEIDIFGQSGFNFTSDQFEGYIHPADYVEIVTNINFLSN